MHSKKKQMQTPFTPTDLQLGNLTTEITETLLLHRAHRETA